MILTFMLSLVQMLLGPLMIQRTPCEITSGYNKQNCSSIGGIVSLVILNFENLDSFLIDDDNLNITAMTMVATKKAYTIKTDKESSTYTQTPTRTRDNNASMVAQTTMFILKDDEEATQKLTNEVREGFFIIIARQKNGKNRVLGLDTGMTLDTEANEVGLLFEDGVKSTLNMIGKEEFKAPLISDSIVDALLIPSS